MHYTSWDRKNVERPELLLDGGPKSLGVFSKDSAEVEGQHWLLDVTEKPVATLPNGQRFELDRPVGRAKEYVADLAGASFRFINEAGNDWVILDGTGTKVAQFSGKNSGVREAIVEFEPTFAQMDVQVAAGLSWFARQILEARTSNSAVAIIATLVLASIVAVASFLL